MPSMLRLVEVFFTLALTIAEVPSADIVQGSEAEEVSDGSQKLISQLTLAMSADVVDERTFLIRDASSRQVHLCLGNTGLTARGSLNDGEYAEKVKVAKDALRTLVEKQMIWYKAAPEFVQPANSTHGTPTVIAEVWSSNGLHIGGFMKKEGHLANELVYDTEDAKDIMSVASEAEKKDSYKKLEEALKESEKAKQEAAKAVRANAEAEEAAENVESFGLAGWLGIGMVLVIVVGAATNFGQPSNKKTNLNRKRGPFERVWMKLKGA